MGLRVGGGVSSVCVGCAVVGVTVGLDEPADKMVGTSVGSAVGEVLGSLQRHFSSVLHAAEPPGLK